MNNFNDMVKKAQEMQKKMQEMHIEMLKFKNPIYLQRFSKTDYEN